MFDIPTKRIQSKNTKTFPFSAHQIWETIIDFEKYSEWWPSTVKLEVLEMMKGLKGSRIKAKPYGGLAFVCEVVDVQPRAKLLMEYSGVYKGTGGWSITENDGHCGVEYDINLEINNAFIRLLSYLLPVEKIHYNLMNDVFSGLEKRLERKFQRQKNVTSQTKQR
jgi:ribosome-associated toxin RatA of RatAB toxin-antitoxin module